MAAYRNEADRAAENLITQEILTPEDYLQHQIDQGDDRLFFIQDKARALQEEGGQHQIQVLSGDPIDLAKAVLGIRSAVLAFSVPRVVWSERPGVKGFGMGMVGPNLEYKLPKNLKGREAREIKAALEEVARLALREAQEAHWAGYLREEEEKRSLGMAVEPEVKAVFDPNMGVERSLADLEVDLDTIRRFSYGSRLKWVLVATGHIVRLEPKEKRAIEQGRKKIGTMLPPATVRVMRPIAGPQIDKRKMYLGLGSAAMLGVMAAVACAEATPAPSPTEVDLPAVTATEAATATVPAKPTEVPVTATTAPTETAVPPTKTPEATATGVAAADIAAQNQDKMGGYYREGMAYSYTEENGVEYMADEYGNKMLKYENGAWIETSKEEKFGHLASKDGDYKPRPIVETAGGEPIGYQFDAYWTGYYYEKTIHFDEVNQNIPVIVIVYVTRDSQTGELVEIENMFGRDMAQVGVGGAFDVDVVDQSGESLIAQIFPPGSLRIFEVFNKHNLNLVGQRAVISAYNLRGYMDRLIKSMKEKNKSCVFDPSTGRSAKGSLGKCERRFYFQLVDDEMVDFGEDVVENLSNGGRESIKLYDTEVHFKIQMFQDKVNAIQADLDELLKELLAGS